MSPISLTICETSVRIWSSVMQYALAFGPQAPLGSCQKWLVPLTGQSLPRSLWPGPVATALANLHEDPPG